jgi:hypothetical protein
VQIERHSSRPNSAPGVRGVDPSVTVNVDGYFEVVVRHKDTSVWQHGFDWADLGNHAGMSKPIRRAKHCPERPYFLH